MSFFGNLFGGKTNASDDVGEEQLGLLEDLDAMHRGTDIEALYPEYNVEQLATRAKQIAEFLDEQRKGGW